jgi:hypothetical protein
MTLHHFLFFYAMGASFFGGWFLTDYINHKSVRTGFEGAFGLQLAYAIVFTLMVVFLWWWFLPREIATRIDKWRRK